MNLITTTTTVFDPSLKGAVVTLKGFSVHAEEEFVDTVYFLVKDVNYATLTVISRFGKEYEIHVHDLDYNEDEDEQFILNVVAESPTANELPF